MKNFTLTLLILCLFNSISKAQDVVSDDYLKRIKNIEIQVWAINKPEFMVRTIPEKYANNSKVIIASHTEISSNNKSKLNFDGNLRVDKVQKLVEINRHVALLNDKSAIEEYSELEFRLSDRSFNNGREITRYPGARIYKKNGSIIDINPKDIVITKNQDAVVDAKLAISDLQIGDIIDYFFATDNKTTNDYSTKSFDILLFDDAPILNLSFHAELDKKYAVDIRNYNGAELPIVKKNEDNELIIDINKSDIPPFETELWVNGPQQLPFIRINTALGYSGRGSRTLQTYRPGEILTNRQNTDLLYDHADDLAKSYMLRCSYTKPYIMVASKKYAFDKKLFDKKASQEQKALNAFYLTRFTKILDFNINELKDKINVGNYVFYGLTSELYCAVRMMDDKPEIVISNFRNGFRLNEIMNTDELIDAVYLPKINKTLSIRSPYTLPFEVPYEMQGVPETKQLNFTQKPVKEKDYVKGPEMPYSESSTNKHIEDLSLTINADNTINANRRTTLKGHYKESAQRKLLLYEDYYNSELAAFGSKVTLIEKLESEKASRKYVEEVKNAFAAARKENKNSFLEEAKEWFDLEITEIDNHKIEQMGVRHTAPDMIYSSTFKLDGLIKKAGKNLIIEVGKLQGSPIQVKEDQRKRDLDIYLTYARTLEYNFKLDIPEGYAAEGLEALKVDVDNESGTFKVETSVAGNQVSINVRKTYKKAFDTKENWNNILAFLDASLQWYDAKLLLKKLD